MPKKSNKVLVIDIGNQAADGRLNDRVFLNSISHTLLPIYELVQQAEALGIKCVTPDVILNNQQNIPEQQTLLVSHLTNAHTDRLIAAGVQPFLLLCQESPLIATRFYINFRSLSRRFRYTMAFTGTKHQAHPRTNFLPMFFPIYMKDNNLDTGIPPATKFLVLMAGNKGVPTWKEWLLKLRYGFRIRSLYPVRKRLVYDLANNKALDIYGRGWDQEKAATIREAYRGPASADAKLTILRDYKFTRCFENAVFPGYITEKIFDAFLAGSVPVYLGAPDILTHVPAEAFIDARDFTSTTALQQRLASMQPEEYTRYQAAGKAFLESSEFKKFHYDTFAEKVLSLIHQV